MAVVCLPVHVCVGHQHACSKLHWLPSEAGQYWINHDNSIHQHYWETPSGMGNHCVYLCVSIHACVSVYRIVQVCVRLCVRWISVYACLCVCVRWLSARSTALHGLLALTAVSKPLLSAYRASTHPHTYTDTLQLPLSFQLLFVPHRHKSLCTSTDIYIG